MFAHWCLVIEFVARTHKVVWFPHINNKVVHSNHTITFTLLLQHDVILINYSISILVFNGDTDSCIMYKHGIDAY